MKTKLSVNINKIALLRNARGTGVPDLRQFALDCYRFGADGITVHPRQDERHITRQDVYELAEVFPKKDCEYNIEGYPDEKFVKMVLEVQPTQVTFVPDASNQLTSDHGWDVIRHFDYLNKIIPRFKEQNIRVALFMDPIKEQLKAVKEAGADRIELYTGPFAWDYEAASKTKKDLNASIAPFKTALPWIEELDLGINAGHDLSLLNLKFFKENIENLLEVSIGHALIRDCLYYGLENTINMYKRLLQ